ncbi:hypothetical protein PUR29_33000 [Methylobacterium ajmalii]|uniref:Uncharacterized protein n=1 Tax=Methylobacterium ajmalii TaxID=2738439 RepID=A0ABV0A3P9_9HYPH
MPAKEMTVRACQQGGFVVYGQIQMMQNPEPLAAFTEIRSALGFVLKAMVPEVAVDPSTSMQEQHLREVESALRCDRPTPLGFYAARGPELPRDEPLMEDDRS